MVNHYEYWHHCATGGRFPRASIEPLPSLRSVQGLGLLAFPAGVAAFRSIEIFYFSKKNDKNANYEIVST